MHIHRKGLLPIFIVLMLTILVALLIDSLLGNSFPVLAKVLYGFLFLKIVWTVSFFRVPHRKAVTGDNLVVSSADGTVVVVEEVFEPEYFKDRRIQISVFMSPFNVHVNWFPMNGRVSYMKYHPGKFLFANNPKSSILNERHSLVVCDGQNREVLVRQIAGMMARRIVWFCKTGDEARFGQEFGLIRFGSRVDFFLPLDAGIKVKLGEKVKATQTIIAELPSKK
ncbi:MAG: phosphatidylserine decarboxylase family protein [Bacteroidales bacterium]|nr:phosphatidylserine decarboxylase family protein [Bacteroidales bacterium]